MTGRYKNGATNHADDLLARLRIRRKSHAAICCCNVCKGKPLSKLDRRPMILSSSLDLPNGVAYD